MPLSRSEWLNLALCAAIIAMLTLAYNLDSVAPPRHIRDSSLSRSTNPNLETMIARLKMLETVIDANEPQASTMTTDVHNTASSLSVERVAARQAQIRPRLVKVCREGKCEKRWAVTA
jgi:hypothetical protein